MLKEDKLMAEFVRAIGPNRLKEIRAAARPTPNRPLWIDTYLNDEQMSELYYRIFEKGEDLRDIARRVRDEWLIRPDWKLTVFIIGMQRWKRVLGTALSQLLHATPEKTQSREAAVKVRNAARKTYKSFDALKRLGWAIEIQTARVKMVHDKEKQANMIIKANDTCVSVLGDLCKDYVNLAVKTGVLDGVPSEINVNFHQTADFVKREVIGANADKMARIAQDFIQAAAQSAITMQRDPKTGEYRLPNDWRDQIRDDLALPAGQEFTDEDGEETEAS